MHCVDSFRLYKKEKQYPCSMTFPVAACLLAVGIAGANSAAADGRSSMALEEVVVTAQKRAEGLQDVPISIAAVSGDKIRSAGMSKLQDLSASVPTLHVGEATGTDQMYIRGIGSGINVGFEQSVGTVVDGVFYGRSRFGRSQFLDLERVEVLKGPQGALFGKNTTAGMINITTANPTDEFEGWVTGTYEFELDETTMEGAISGPLTETVRARLAMRWNEQNDGWVDNEIVDSDEPESREKAGRLTVAWDASEDIEVIGKITWGEHDKDGRNNQLTHCTPTLLAIYANNGINDDCKLNDKKQVVGPRDSSGRLDNIEEQETDYTAYTVAVNWELGEYIVSSVTNYSEYEYLDLFNSSPVALDLATVEVYEDYEQFSQEIRLASPAGEALEYIVGAYYEENSNDSYLIIDQNWALSGLVAGPNGSMRVPTEQDYESWALFGQLTWSVSDTVRATVSARYTEEEKDAHTISRFYQLYTDNLLVPFYNVDDKFDNDNLSGTASVQWDINSDVMIYAKLGTGYKGGGFNQQMFGPVPQAAAEANYIFDEETVIAYELGMKSTLLDGAAEFNVALFYSEFDDMQVSAQEGDSFTVANAGSAISQGVEIDGRWRLTENLTLIGNLAYLDSYYDEFEGNQCYQGQTEALGCIDGAQDSSGQKTMFAPEWSANLGLKHVLPLGNSLELTSSVDINYSDDYWLIVNADPFLEQDAFTKVDARVALGASDGQWEIALLGRNLTDEETSTWGNVPLKPASMAPLGHYRHLDRLRTIAVQASWRL